MLDSDIEDIIRQYKILKSEIDDYKKGDIYPSENSPIVIKDEVKLLKSAKWGFPLQGKKRLVINARSESIIEKPMFRDAFYGSRCIIPANLFYEWKDEGNKKKTKHKIYLKDQKILSLGGIYKSIIDESGKENLSFVIITTEANNYMKDIHSRMPLIIDDEVLDYWLDGNSSIRLLKKIFDSNMSKALTTEAVDKDEPFEQLRLF